MVCQTDNRALLQRTECRVLDRLAGVLVHNAEHDFEGLALGLLLPARQVFGHRVQEYHVALGVRGNHGIPDARQRRVEPLPLFLENYCCLQASHEAASE